VQAADDLERLRPTGGDVAEADDLVDGARGDVSKDHLERDAVAVDIADEGDAGQESSLVNPRRTGTRRSYRRRGRELAGSDMPVVEVALDDEHGRLGCSQR
jgi:hypothetical protein